MSGTSRIRNVAALIMSLSHPENDDEEVHQFANDVRPPLPPHRD